MKKLSDYEGIIPDKEIRGIKELAERLVHEHIVMINSTPMGGGVVEILNALIVLMNNLHIDVGWRIIKGTNDFFQVTKSFHNALQSGEMELEDWMTRLYEETNRVNAIQTHLKRHDLVVIHDPQPCALIEYSKKRQPWIWRCHIDLSNPNKEFLDYLSQYICQYDAAIVSTKDYKLDGMSFKQYIIPPAIDPVSVKNREMGMNKIKKVLHKHGIDPDEKPIISQVSRYDKWKDPVGVVETFKKVKEKFDCQLVLMGNMATDDPEGPEIYEKVLKAAEGVPDVKLLLNVEDNDRTVNALQTASDVVLQKSTKEGFGLTVTEAMWKGTPVVGGNVGGIPVQIVDGETGYLVNSIDEAAKSTLKLLEDDNLREKMGRQAKERVRDNFLITRLLKDYLHLFDHFLSKKYRFRHI